MMDKDTGRPRGFGFVTFESEAGVDACLNTSLEIHGKPIEVKKAQPRGNLREDEESQRRAGKFGRKGQQGNSPMEETNQGTMNASMGSGNNQGGGGQGNMTPQMFAQYMQRMQQAFNMMQQQMAMNRTMGGQINPMMQMMQMQQMQQMQQMMAQAQAGRGGANPMAGMNPQMMQQLQQMQQMMGQQGGASPQGPGGPANRQGFGGGFEQPQFDQQQQQKYDQQNRQGGGYAGNQAGYNPTSWEGMYDDVPQPMMNQGGGGGGGAGGGRGGFRNRGAQFQNQNQNQVQRDPNAAPPANAPTGPKYAGKPGANYRGGGRGGGNRGFHPYGRG